MDDDADADAKVARLASYFEPVRKSIAVALRADHAFSVFTAGLSRWWPPATHSISEALATSCAIDPVVGGLAYEIRDDGQRIQWGWVLEWDPPTRFVLAWHTGCTPEQAQEVELRFGRVGDGTRVDLEHRGWEKLGDGAGAAREGYDDGWQIVFVDFYARACAGQGRDAQHRADPRLRRGLTPAPERSSRAITRQRRRRAWLI